MSLYEDAGPEETGFKASWLAAEMCRAGLDVDSYELHLALAKALDRSPFVVVREKELLELLQRPRESMVLDRDPGRVYCCWPTCSLPAMRHAEGWKLCPEHTHLAWSTVQDSKELPEISEWEIKREALKRERREKADAARAERGVQPGFIYYLRIGDQVKIGYAADVRKRMRAYPPDAQLLAVHPGTPDLEKVMHRNFEHCLAAGREWFDPAPPLMEHIANVVSVHGSPAQHAHHYRRRTTRHRKDRA